MLILQIVFGILIANLIMFLLRIEGVGKFIVLFLVTFLFIGIMTLAKPQAFDSANLVKFYYDFFH